MVGIHRPGPVDRLEHGGIAGPEDLPAFVLAGASAVLIGSALHDGRIGVRDLEMPE